MKNIDNKFFAQITGNAARIEKSVRQFRGIFMPSLCAYNSDASHGDEVPM
jgi:hypothetical protein